MRRCPRALACFLVAFITIGGGADAYDIAPELRAELEAWAKANQRQGGTAGDLD